MQRRCPHESQIKEVTLAQQETQVREEFEDCEAVVEPAAASATPYSDHLTASSWRCEAQIGFSQVTQLPSRNSSGEPDPPGRRETMATKKSKKLKSGKVLKDVKPLLNPQPLPPKPRPI
jgi:hypothetical protein